VRERVRARAHVRPHTLVLERFRIFCVLIQSYSLCFPSVADGNPIGSWRKRVDSRPASLRDCDPTRLEFELTVDGWSRASMHARARPQNTEVKYASSSVQVGLTLTAARHSHVVLSAIRIKTKGLRRSLGRCLQGKLLQVFRSRVRNRASRSGRPSKFRDEKHVGIPASRNCQHSAYHG